MVDVRDFFAAQILSAIMQRWREPSYADKDAVVEAYSIADWAMEVRASNSGAQPPQATNSAMDAIATRAMEKLCKALLDDHACEHAMIGLLVEVCNEYRSQQHQ